MTVAGLGWGLGFWISEKLPDAAAAPPPTPGVAWLREVATSPSQPTGWQFSRGKWIGGGECGAQVPNAASERR